ncbi:TPA: TIGR02099 family protein [Escherichia coli]|nr:TIGR02099 family protein [Escherichia coli]
MRRLPGILLLTGAALVVIAALLVSGLRIALPHLDAWRPEILNKIESATGMPVEASQLSASWQNFGPTLEAHDIRAELKDGGEFSVKRVTLALDVWQSLLHMRWQFRDLTFWQLRFRTNTPITSGGGNDSLEASHISDLFLRQFDHFDLRDSEVSFLTPSGQRAELAIPQLTWLNDPRRHRAEGLVSLSSLTGQHGVMQVRMDLRDDEGLLSNGRVWLQADDIDLKPWLGKWMQDNIALETAQFSLEGWMTIDKGDVTGGDVWLKQGGASWLGEKETHTLSVDNLTAHITRENPGWQFSIPDTRITMDGKPWPSGALTLAWIPEQDVGGKDNKRSDELRIRASNLELAGLEGVRPLVAKLSPALGDVWRSTQPSGKINTLALDIPLQAADKTRFQASWSDLAWKQWKLLPGAEHFSGTLSGSVENGLLTASMKQAKMPYETVFRAPLEIADGQATISWLNNDKGFQLDGRNIDVKAKAVHARGGFRYLQPANDEPWLGILAGISTDDGSQAWRYFPENLMGKDLVDYLSGAIQGGEADNATLVYGGNPQLFPYKHNEGQFEVLVPLRNAKFAFQPDWPALTNLDIELDFINDGLWMKTDGVNLGGVRASNLTAVLPDYSKEKLLIDADIKGPGKAVGPYFDETPLKDSLGATLQELQLDGDVNARLHLDIPLNGDLKNVSSHLPSPLAKPAGEPLPVNVKVDGNLNSFELTGQAGADNHFNSCWLLGQKLTLDRAIWAADSKTLPPLPEQSGVELNMPPMNGAEWLALFQKGAAESVGGAASFPQHITLRTPMLSLGNQQWNNLSIVSQPTANGTLVEAQGREINATLAMRNNAPWLANIKYLYYNPSVAKTRGDSTQSSPFPTTERINFRGWPDAQIRCAECWFWGQKFGRIDSDITISGDTLTLTNGLIDTGFARLTADGEWVNNPGNERTSLKGKLRGQKIDAAAEFFGVTTPIRQSSFNVDYDLHWRKAPWQPDEVTLNGIIHTQLGKGEITEINTGHAGQLLRLLSVDALMRKLRFDFRDTFGEGFYFDSIRSTAWIKDGVMHTDDTLVDGLEADIAMKGSVNLVRRDLNMEAVVAPEISATVGVAAAFAVNPIVGAAVFAASKVLGPLWSKVSILRYHISGPLDDPQINEVLRQPRKEKAQ